MSNSNLHCLKVQRARAFKHIPLCLASLPPLFLVPTLLHFPHFYFLFPSLIFLFSSLFSFSRPFPPFLFPSLLSFFSPFLLLSFYLPFPTFLFPFLLPFPPILLIFPPFSLSFPLIFLPFFSFSFFPLFFLFSSFFAFASCLNFFPPLWGGGQIEEYAPLCITLLRKIRHDGRNFHRFFFLNIFQMV